MRQRLHIPPKVRNAIETHVRKRFDEVHERYWSAAEDEDTFTGHLGALLGCSERRTDVGGQAWRWRIEYSKFRGRGPGASERFLGADGIFEIRITGPEVDGRKSILFQAKMESTLGIDALKQALALSNWREAAVFLTYTEPTISVYPIDAVLRTQIAGNLAMGMPFPDFFLGTFLGCKMGDSDLEYDPRNRFLQWRDDTGHRVGVQFAIPDRIRVSIKSPAAGSKRFQRIAPESIAEHRMDSTAQERMGLEDGFTPKQLAQAKREAALAFHPDRLQRLPEPLRNVLNARMGEFNKAFAELKKRRKE
jgi:hypothetical protein